MFYEIEAEELVKPISVSEVFLSHPLSSYLYRSLLIVPVSAAMAL